MMKMLDRLKMKGSPGRGGAGVMPAVLCWMLLCALPAAAQDRGTNEFLFRNYTNAKKQTLPYRLLVPKQYDPKKSYPVILYLHGAAGRGSDNVAPLEWGPLFFLDDALRDKHDFFLVVPQCPRSEAWLDSSLLDTTWKESS